MRLKYVSAMGCFICLMLFGTSCSENELQRAASEEFVITAPGDGDQLIPIINGEGVAHLSGLYETTTNTFNFTLSWEDLWSKEQSEVITAIELHGSAAKGENGELKRSLLIQSSLGRTGSLLYSLTGHQGLLQSERDELLAGNWYYVICTTNHPEGIVRGQLNVGGNLDEAYDVKKIVFKKGGEVEVKEGESMQMEITVQPTYAANQEVKWETSHPEVATIKEKGEITGITMGEALITVTTLDGSGVSASCKVIVINPDIVQKLNFTNEYLLNVLTAGQTFELKVQALPETALNKAVTFESSDISIATVDKSGVVTGVSTGKVTITATSTDGRNVKATCEIAVNMSFDKLDRTGWDVTCSSEKASDGGGRFMILNDDYTKYWHSQWSPNAPLPHWLLIDMLKEQTISRIEVYRRVNAGKTNTDTKTVVIEVSLDGISFSQVGTISYGGDEAGLGIQFPPREVRYVKLNVTESNRAPFANLSSLCVFALK